MKKKNWIVVALCVAIVGMGIGFAALAQNLQISATANITGEWDVRVNSIHPSNSSGATSLSHSFDGTSLAIEADLQYPGAWIVYDIFVQNFGNIDAILNSITGVTAANSTEPSEIKVSVYMASPHVGMTVPVSVDTNYGVALNANEIHALFVRLEWVSEAGVDSTIPDVKSKTVSINANYSQNT